MITNVLRRGNIHCCEGQPWVRNLKVQWLDTIGLIFRIDSLLRYPTYQGWEVWSNHFCIRTFNDRTFLVAPKVISADAETARVTETWDGKLPKKIVGGGNFFFVAWLGLVSVVEGVFYETTTTTTTTSTSTVATVMMKIFFSKQSNVSRHGTCSQKCEINC